MPKGLATSVLLLNLNQIKNSFAAGLGLQGTGVLAMQGPHVAMEWS